MTTSKSKTAGTAVRRGVGYLIAKQSFLAPGGRNVQKGAAVEADDPVVKGREGLFEKAEDYLRNTKR